MKSIRGAITVKFDTKEEVITNTKILLEKIISLNNIEINEIISIIFTATKDITSEYPAKAARELSITKASLMCMQEMFVENSLEKCIRVMVLVDNLKKDVVHVYLKEAKKLRPDLKI